MILTASGGAKGNPIQFSFGQGSGSHYGISNDGQCSQPVAALARNDHQARAKSKRSAECGAKVRRSACVWPGISIQRKEEDDVTGDGHRFKRLNHPTFNSLQRLQPAERIIIARKTDLLFSTTCSEVGHSLQCYAEVSSANSLSPAQSSTTSWIPRSEPRSRRSIK
jgi:hypothetical protein